MTAQASVETRELMDEIVATLISRFHPRRIYLFGSRGRGDARPDSDYDFLIEVDRTPEGIAIRRESKDRLRDFPAADVQLHVRYHDELERRKDDPGTVDWDVVREGRLLFASPGVPPLRPAPKGGRVSEVNRTPPNSLPDWLARAEEDLEVALALSAEFRWPNTICFHCQQSGEKFLKALIIAQHEHPAHTHELDELLEHLLGLGLPLSELQADCVLLSKFSVRTRYPDDKGEAGSMEEARFPEPILFSEQDAKDALSALNRIVAAVRPYLP